MSLQHVAPLEADFGGRATCEPLIAHWYRRPIRINNGDFDVPMLELSDFETKPMPSELSRLLGGCPVGKDASKRVTWHKCVLAWPTCAFVSAVLLFNIYPRHRIGVTQETT